MDCQTCRVRVRTEWCDLAGRDLALLNEAKSVFEYDADEEIFQQGTPSDGLRYVSKGMVATLRRWEGRAPVHVNIRYPGDTLGLRSWLCGGNHLATARTLEPSSICLISGVALTKLMANNPGALFCFLWKLVSDLDIAEERLFQRTSLHARTRLAKLLMAFKMSHGSPGVRGGVVISLPLSQRQIAAAIGVSPASLSRVIRNLAQDGVARFRGRLVYIDEPQRLLMESRPVIAPGS
jgi:CRP-like cAMP-binding protein